MFIIKISDLEVVIKMGTAITALTLSVITATQPESYIKDYNIQSKISDIAYKTKTIKCVETDGVVGYNLVQSSIAENKFSNIRFTSGASVDEAINLSEHNNVEIITLRLPSTEDSEDIEIEEEEVSEDYTEEIVEDTIDDFEIQVNMVDQSDALLEIESPDASYNGAVVTVSDTDRSILERLVMGEAGGEGFAGAALVAQCIRDTIVYRGAQSVESVRLSYGYTGTLTREPNQDVLNAVSFIFDQGGCAVKHKLFYFYAPKKVNSAFHESQHFIIEHGGHRFFSTW